MLTAEHIAKAIEVLTRMQHIEVSNIDPVQIGSLRAQAFLAALDLRLGMRNVAVPVAGTEEPSHA